MTYRGRFAPSPTGPLHLGSLIAATFSYLQARKAQGQWLLRIEDLDLPRTVPGSADHIQRTLEAFGLTWDEPIIFQSQRTEAYEQALQFLIDQQQSYPCSCTRSELQALQRSDLRDHDELRYPGLCRHGPMHAQGPFAWRFRVPAQPICFTDALQGMQCLNLADSIGDFVIKRRDGWFAYQLAVVVDDAAQGITEVVRGIDLLSNTPRQIALQHALHLPTPTYLHLPVVTDATGHKLSKSTAATSVDNTRTGPTLWHVLSLLLQCPPPALQTATLNTLWQWAIEHWNPNALRQIRQIVHRDDNTEGKSTN